MTSSKFSDKIGSSYKNITISGGVGVGSTTLMKNLTPILEPLGFTLTSTGALMREKMHEFKNPRADLVNDTIHEAVEKDVYGILASGKTYVVEGWLAGFIARKIDHTLRVLVYASNDAVRIDRIINRDSMTVKEARHMIHEREKVNFETWKRIYGDYDFWDPAYYHLTIDTCQCGPQESVGKVLDALGYSG